MGGRVQNWVRKKREVVSYKTGRYRSPNEKPQHVAAAEYKIVDTAFEHEFFG